MVHSRTCCLLAACAGAGRGPPSVLAIVPASLGGLTLFEHLTGIDLGIDQLLATEPAGALATGESEQDGTAGVHCERAARCGAS